MATIKSYADIAAYEGGTLGATPGQRENIGNVRLVEHGVDVSFGPKGGVGVILPAAGWFESALSTPLQQVFLVGGNVYESLAHTNLAQGIKDQQFVPAGTVAAYTDPTGVGYGLFSTGPHVEIGFAHDVKSAMDFFGSQAIDPLLELTGQVPGGVGNPTGIGATSPSGSTTVTTAPPSAASTAASAEQMAADRAATTGQICPINFGPWRMCFPNPVQTIEHALLIVGVVVFILLIVALLGKSLIERV